jgi:hypothetical protein
MHTIAGQFICIGRMSLCVSAAPNGGQGKLLFALLIRHEIRPEFGKKANVNGTLPPNRQLTSRQPIPSGRTLDEATRRMCLLKHARATVKLAGRLVSVVAGDDDDDIVIWTTTEFWSRAAS